MIAKTRRKEIAKGKSRIRSSRRSHFHRLNFPQTPLEESTFTIIGHQRERALIALRSFSCCAHAAQQIRARGM